MSLNFPGILVPFQLLVNPRIIIPGLVVKDIRQVDFFALKKAGYRGAIFDKDNCLTVPHRDTLVPELEDAWLECRQVFGENHVLIVSNSAGTRQDPGGIQAESVSTNLGVPVLFHKTPKPGYSCISAIRRYFSSLHSPVKDHDLVIVGDRLFTDVVMANRMYPKTSLFRSSPPSDEKPTRLRPPLSIWTTALWKKDAMLVRWCEKQLLASVQKYSKPPAVELETEQFIKQSPPPEEPKQGRRVLRTIFGRLLSKTR